MHSRPELRLIVKVLLENYGKLKTNQVAKQFKKFIIFDMEDLDLNN